MLLNNLAFLPSLAFFRHSLAFLLKRCLATLHLLEVQLLQHFLQLRKLMRAAGMAFAGRWGCAGLE